MAKMIHYEDEEKQRAHQAVDLGAWESELALTEEKSAQLGSPIVWSHNDLLSGNVLVSKQVQHLERIFYARTTTWIHGFLCLWDVTKRHPFWSCSDIVHGIHYKLKLETVGTLCRTWSREETWAPCPPCSL